MSEFQSTLPGWGATANNSRRITQVTHFNPRSPDGERRRCGQSLSISFIFQSTLPGWGATLNRRQTRKHFGSISIHAPRMGSDPTHCPISRSRRYFNPRSPDGERRRMELTKRRRTSYFNPRSPDGERPSGRRLPDRRQPISIHAPRMGSDRENGHLRPRYGQNHPFSTLIVSQIVVDVLGTVRKSQKHQRTSHYEVIKQPERRK